MPTPKPKPEVIEAAMAAIREHGNVNQAARAIGVAESTLRGRMEFGIRAMGLTDPRSKAVPHNDHADNETEVAWGVENGVFVAFGDAHWSNPTQPRSAAHEALIKALPHLRPDHLLATGDLADFGEISRHDPVGWQPKTHVKATLDAVRLHLDELRDLAPKAKCWWCIGNHDWRHDDYLARNAAAFEGEAGFRLTDKFAEWRMAYRFDFSAFVALHRWHSGIHAAHNNAVKSGVSIVSADTHKLRVTPHDDLRGRRYGVETGMLADPNWPVFRYLRGKPTAWTPGWVVLTVRGGRLLQPETCEVLDGVAWFRGEPLAGKPRVRVRAA